MKQLQPKKGEGFLRMRFAKIVVADRLPVFQNFFSGQISEEEFTAMLTEMQDQYIAEQKAKLEKGG